MSALYKSIRDKKKASMTPEAWAEFEGKYQAKWSKAVKDRLHKEFCARCTMLPDLEKELGTRPKGGFAAAWIEDEILDCHMNRLAIKAQMDADHEASMAAWEARKAIEKSFAPRIEAAKKVADEASRERTKAFDKHLESLWTPSTKVCTDESIAADKKAKNEASSAYYLARDADTEAQDHLTSLRAEMKRKMDSTYSDSERWDADASARKRAARS